MSNIKQQSQLYTKMDLVNALYGKYKPENPNDLLCHAKIKLSDAIIPSDIYVTSGQGAILETNKGALIDLSSMTLNCILGQNDFWVTANLAAFILSNRPSFLTTRLGSEFYYKIAARIANVSKIEDPFINHRQCNGSDVTELAILAAHGLKKDRNFIASFKHSYHGQNLTSYLTSGMQNKHVFLVENRPTIFFESPDGTDRISIGKLSSQDANTLQKFYNLRHKIFAVIIEPIQVNNCVNIASVEFLKQLKTICEENEIALIYDEVQTGFGWLGTMTAAEKYNVMPNLMALSKAVTAGYGPLSVLVGEQKYRHIEYGTGEKTNGADARSLIAANAVMDRLLGIPKKHIPNELDDRYKQELHEGLLCKVSYKSQKIFTLLEDLKISARGMIGKIKGEGLIYGMEILDKYGKPDTDIAAKLEFDIINKGVFIRRRNHTLLLKPPIVIEDETLFKAFDIIKKIVTKRVKI